MSTYDISKTKKKTNVILLLVSIVLLFVGLVGVIYCPIAMHGILNSENNNIGSAIVIILVIPLLVIALVACALFLILGIISLVLSIRLFKSGSEKDYYQKRAAIIFDVVLLYLGAALCLVAAFAFLSESNINYYMVAGCGVVFLVVLILGISLSHNLKIITNHYKNS